MLEVAMKMQSHIANVKEGSDKIEGYLARLQTHMTKFQPHILHGALLDTCTKERLAATIEKLVSAVELIR